MQPRSATIVVDLGFGDAGKGTIIDFLARKSQGATVVRFNGGAQAGHNVITSEGKHHTFTQFGSGAFVPGVRTHLSRFVLVDPVYLSHEANYLIERGCARPFDGLTVDARALVVTPFHKAANHLREILRGQRLHGSCGMGIGETMADSLTCFDSVYVRDFRDCEGLTHKLRSIQERKRAEFKDCLEVIEGKPQFTEDLSALCDPDYPKKFAKAMCRFGVKLSIVPGNHLRLLADRGDLLFDGAQGVLLDEWHGFHPYTTWSTTTFANALALLDDIGYEDEIYKLGVLRAYHTRHGAGPFVTQDETLTQLLPDPHNPVDEWQGSFRAGWFDLVMARYALEVSGGVDALAITNLDRFASASGRKVCTAYRFSANDLTPEEENALVKIMTTPHDTGVRVSSFQKKKFLTDLSYQEVLTRLLSKAMPCYQYVPHDSESYLELLERELGVPVSIASFGPTALDKRLRLQEKSIAA